jgi:hypothetical protein
VNFTREPLVETVITPKEGYKLVVRNSKGGGQEEFFVDAVEVISFGNASFLRSLEKPKCFLVPVSDYEILEVRESRMVLKTSGTERGIKIGGGRETLLKVSKEEAPIQEVETTAMVEQRADKRRERRRSRKRRGKGEQEEAGEELPEPSFPSEPPKEKRAEKPSLIPPPSTLISETIARHRILAVPEETISKEQGPLTPPPPRIVTQSDHLNEEDEEIPF